LIYRILGFAFHLIEACDPFLEHFEVNLEFLALSEENIIQYLKLLLLFFYLNAPLWPKYVTFQAPNLLSLSLKLEFEFQMLAFFFLHFLPLFY
jgi:hypothetical protein